MGTSIKVSEEITKGLGEVKRGDVVKSINHGGIVLVVESFSDTFAGIVLDKGDYVDYEVNEFGFDFAAKNFKPFVGTITLECE